MTIRFSRSWVATGLALVSLLVGLRILYVSRVLGLAQQRVTVAWVPDLGDQNRLVVERELGLLSGEPSEGPSWSYLLRDRSVSRVRALVEHPYVRDTQHIDRQRYRVVLDRQELAPVTRWLVETDASGPVGTAFAVLGCVGLFLCRARLATVGRSVGELERRLGRYGPPAVGLFLVFPLGVAFRFLATDGFSNDHFVHLAAAQQMLFGDLPTRDFIDIGRPLTIVMSAAAQKLWGWNLLTESVLVSAGFGAGAVLTLVAATALTGRLSFAFVAALLELVAFPRSYSYPKVLAMAAVSVVLVGAIRRPSRPQLLRLAAVTVVALMFRHDLGLFAACGCLTALLLPDVDVGIRVRLRRIAIFGAWVAVGVSPYLLYVHHFGGIGNYVATTLAASAAEAGHVWPNPLSPAAHPADRLLYLFHLLPVCVIALCALQARRSRLAIDAKAAVAVAVMAIPANILLMREPLDGRVPDAIVPAVLCAVWLVGRGLGGASLLRLGAVAVASLLFVVEVGRLGAFPEQLDAAGFTSVEAMAPSQVVARIEERAGDLRARYGHHAPSAVIPALTPFLDYIDRCTPRDAALFLGGMMPEVAYYARRPFAGGAYEHYNFTSPRNQQIVVDRLRRKMPLFILIPGTSEPVYREQLSIVSGFLSPKYQALTSIETRAAGAVAISSLIGTSWAGTDEETGWPCGAPAGSTSLRERDQTEDRGPAPPAKAPASVEP